jgi:hypothetical protein
LLQASACRFSPPRTASSATTVRTVYDPIDEEEDETARPDDDEPHAGMIASGIDCSM